MTVRRKTFLVVGSVLTLVMGVLYVAARGVLCERFWVVEQSRAQQHATAVMDDLADELSTMLASVRTLRAAAAHWDEPDRAMLTELQDAAVACRANQQAMALVDKEGRLGRWTVFPGADLGNSDCDAVAAYLAEHQLLESADTTRGGVVCLGSGAYVVALTRGAQGGLVLVRPAKTDTLGLDDSVVFGGVGPASGEPGLLEAARVNRPVEIAYDSGTVVTTQEFADLSGTTLIRAATAQRPVGVEQSTQVVWLVRIALLAAVVLCTALTMVLLNSQVLRPLNELVRQLRGIGAGARDRIDLLSPEEVGEVAFAVNGMLAALDASRASLAESEARFRSMVDNSPLGVFLCDVSGLAVFQNAECQKLLGQPAGTTLGNAWDRAIHPADRARVVANWRQACAHGRKFREHFRILHPDGTLHWASAHAAPVLKEGQITGFVGTVEDTTARLQAQEELRRAKTAAESASFAKSEFLANMSHEIRTPMTAILGFCDLLMEPGQPEGERLASLQTIRRNGEHLLTIINDILDLSRIEAGRAAVERVACSPAEVIGGVVSLLGHRAASKGVSLEVAFGTPIPSRITNDPTKLRQVLINLVGNAVKFTEAGSVRVTARTAVFHDGTPRLEVEVADTGIGMTAEQVSRLFRPFSQADSSMSRRYGGTGLGLSISQKLASLMGGSIAVRSEAGRGSVFTLSIEMGATEGPMVSVLPVCAQPAAPQRPSVELRARVLVAEDGEDNQRLIEHVLTRAGAHVTMVADGHEAVSAAQGGGFDLIIMDMQMPGMDGYAATRMLRSKGYRGAIIALTAHAMADDREKCLRAGCSDYATKPLDRAAFIAMCARWVDQGAGRDAAAA